MKLAGSSSWTFGHGIGQLPHAALYVRDVTGLQPPPDPILPPRLALPDDERSDVFDEAGRAEVGAQWLRWWQALVVDEAALRRDSSGGFRPDLWPGDDGWIAGLGSDQAVLQQAVAAAFADGCRWFDRHRPQNPIPAARASGGTWSVTSPRMWHAAITSAPEPCTATRLCSG